jgi:thiaminase
MDEENEKTIVLKVFTNEFEAELAKGMLEEEKIKCYISSDDTGGMGPYLQLTLGIRLLVLENDYERAKEILDAYSSFTPEKKADNLEETDVDEDDEEV